MRVERINDNDKVDIYPETFSDVVLLFAMAQLKLIDSDFLETKIYEPIKIGVVKAWQVAVDINTGTSLDVLPPGAEKGMVVLSRAVWCFTDDEIYSSVFSPNNEYRGVIYDTLRELRRGDAAKDAGKEYEYDKNVHNALLLATSGLEFVKAD